MTTSSLHSLAFVDRLSAFLRDATEPMTAREIGRQMGKPLLWPCGANPCIAAHGMPGQLAKSMGYVHAEHLGDCDAVFTTRMLGGSVTPHLEQLKHAGVVERRKVGRNVVWRWVPDPVQLDLVDLEVMLLGKVGR